LEEEADGRSVLYACSF